MSWTGQRRGRVDRFEPPVAELVPSEWEKQPGESWVAFMAFQAWLDMGCEGWGRRSLSVVAEPEGKSLNLMKRWSHRWRWRERAKCRDDFNYQRYLWREVWGREWKEEMERRRDRLDEALGSVGLGVFNLEDAGLDLDKLLELMDHTRTDEVLASLDADLRAGLDFLLSSSQE